MQEGCEGRLARADRGGKSGWLQILRRRNFLKDFRARTVWGTVLRAEVDEVDGAARAGSIIFRRPDAGKFADHEN
jgi:hypothetical protein